MAILSTGWERVKGAFKVLIGGAAAIGLKDILTGALKEHGVSAGVDFIKTFADGRGLKNEAVYGYILGRCALKNDERSLLIYAIEELRRGTEEESEAANNFIVLVSLGDPDKNGRRPGEKIIHGFIHRINNPALTTDAERLQMIKDNIVHIGTNAEVKTKVDAVQKWAIGVWENDLKPLIDALNVKAEKYKTDSEKALDDFNKQPLWKKLFKNYT